MPSPAWLLLLFPVSSIALVIPSWQYSVIHGLENKLTRNAPSPLPPQSEFAAHRLPHIAACRMMSSEDVDDLCGVLPDVCADVEADADAVFSVVDIDGDGSITQSELQEHLSKAGYNDAAINVIFDKLDIDADGIITRTELRAGFLKYTPLREAPGLGSYNAEFINEIHADADALFNAIDTDGNGSISKEELRNHLKQFSQYTFKAISSIFKMLDANKDGNLERTELREAFVKYSALRLAIGEGPNFK